MATFTMRINDCDLSLIQSYASSIGQSVSAFVKETVLDHIEDELKLDEDRILAQWEENKNERGVSLAELDKMMGL